jgi:hypothetical protein
MLTATQTAQPPLALDGWAEDACGPALLTVNTVAIDLYWRVGEYLSRRSDKEGWGQGTVAALSAYIQKRHPGVRGFSPQKLWRMRQFSRPTASS